MEPNQKFVYTDAGVTAEHLQFFDAFGFIHYKHFFSPQQIQRAIQAIEELEAQWIAEKKDKVFGTPIKYGKDESGRTVIHRFAFASLHHPYLHEMLQDPRLQELKKFLGDVPDARIAENEKDGLVINHYINTGESEFTKLGWHTDGLRDLVLNFKLYPMLNVGIYLDDSPVEKGGLRVLPGTHKQNLYQMMFRKKYFVDNTPDPDELIIEAEAGDLTVHSGRIWHRVALATVQGAASRRRVMYFPIISGKYSPKSHRSPTPIYHRFLRMIK
ncbi:MAG: phytanoyl-CoA dioxygenase family protein [Thermoflavifilum sp.]|nr:phytanoyl-CoA dioxygenase family protein [Thermoflavifilum sp.]